MCFSQNFPPESGTIFVLTALDKRLLRAAEADVPALLLSGDRFASPRKRPPQAGKFAAGAFCLWYNVKNGREISIMAVHEGARPLLSDKAALLKILDEQDKKWGFVFDPAATPQKARDLRAYRKSLRLLNA